MPRTLPAQLATLALVALLGFAGAPAATALTIDFEEFPNHGDVVAMSQGVTIIAENGAIDLAVVFLTEETPSGEDLDLQRHSGWSGGNLSPDTVLGNILILQENSTGCGSGTCLLPDDEGSRPAGDLTFLFEETFQSFSFDLVDVEDNNDEPGRIRFLLGNGEVASFEFNDFLGLGQGVEFGNNTANHVDLGFIGDFDTVVIEMGGSGGVDNLTALVVPEPTTATLLGLGLLALGVTGRRRN